MTRAQQKATDAVHSVIDVCHTLAELLPNTLTDFENDTRTQWAVEMGLIRIGEGINRIPQEVLDRCDGQPWRQIIGMRNFAAHQYDDLDPKRVWRTVTQDIPLLRNYLEDVVLPSLA